MSNTSSGSQQEERPQVSKAPRALIHKQILDIAETQPTASVEEIAAEVSGATGDLVERVLDEYGDPAEDNPEPDPTAGGGNGQSASDAGPVTEAMNKHDTSQEADHDPMEIQLTEKQRETLQAIAEQPDATQQELADQFDVSIATINKRVNSIDGFDWADRHTFITTMVENGATKLQNGATTQAVQELSDRVDALAKQVTDLERQLADQPTPSGTPFTDPDLVHKVVHACMRSDQITEEEELRILNTILTTQGRSE